MRRCITRSCLVCGYEFVVPVNRNKRTCSTRCRGLAGRRRLIIKCPVCDKQFEATKSRREVTRGRPCCSRACRNVAQTVNSGFDVIRPHHYGTAEGRSALYLLKKHWPDDCIKCASCGLTFRPMLTIHHIDGDEMNNSLSNLEYVCWIHHAARHMKLDECGNWQYATTALTPRHQLPIIEHMIEASRPTTHARAEHAFDTFPEGRAAIEEVEDHVLHDL